MNIHIGRDGDPKKCVAQENHCPLGGYSKHYKSMSSAIEGAELRHEVEAPEEKKLTKSGDVSTAGKIGKWSEGPITTYGRQFYAESDKNNYLMVKDDSDNSVYVIKMARRGRPFATAEKYVNFNNVKSAKNWVRKSERYNNMWVDHTDDKGNTVNEIATSNNSYTVRELNGGYVAEINPIGSDLTDKKVFKTRKDAQNYCAEYDLDYQKYNSDYIDYMDAADMLEY